MKPADIESGTERCINLGMPPPDIDAVGTDSLRPP